MCAKLALGVLRVERAAREAAAGGEPEHDRDRRPRAVVLLRRDGDEVVPRAGDEVGELHLGHRAHAHQRGAGGAGDDRRLGERHVEHAPRPELLLEALSVTLNAPPYTPTSSPSTKTRWSRRISWRSAVRDRLEVGLLRHQPRLTGDAASRARPGVGEHAVEHGRRVGERGLLGALDRLVEQALDARGDLVLLVVRQLGVVAEPGAEALDRVAPRPLLEHLLRDVERVVVDGVTLHAERQATRCSVGPPPSRAFSIARFASR